MEEQQLSKEQQDYLNNLINRGIAFEEMKHNRGWEMVETYIQNVVRQFANTAVLKGFSSIEEMNLERGKVIGLQGLLTEINNAIKALEDDRSKNRS